MKKILFVLSLIAVGVCGVWKAEACTEITDQQAFEAALALEKINGGELDLSSEIMPYSGVAGWAVTFSRSGVQSSWSVETDDTFCEIRHVRKVRSN